jgi:hypothetical protein
MLGVGVRVAAGNDNFKKFIGRVRQASNTNADAFSVGVSDYSQNRRPRTVIKYSDGTQTELVLPSGHLDVASGQQIIVGATYLRNNAAGLRLFVDGSSAFTAATQDKNAFDVTALLFAAEQSGGSENTSLLSTLVALWDRALSDAEMASLHSNPWQIFEDSTPADTTAPTLTTPTATATGSANASGTVTTDEANGTLYRLASANATETAATVIAAALSQAVTATGVQNVSFSGLTASTTYYAHFVHVDAAANQSAVASSASFTTTTPDTTAPVLTGSITASSITSGTFSTTCPVATDNVAVAAYDVSEDGGSTWIDNGLSRTYSHTGKTAETTYQIRWRARDGSANTSAVLSLAVTTFAPGATGQYILDNTGPTGENQAGILYNDVEAGDEDKWFSFVITTPPASGTLDIAPDGTFTFTGAASTTFQYQLYVDGVAIGTPVLVTVYDDALVQFYRPTGDVSAPGWLSTAGTLAGAINETTPSDASYITSPDVGSAAPYRSTIASMAAGTYTMRLRARRTASVGEVRVVMLSAANAPVGTSAWQALSTGFAAYSLPVTTTGTATQFDLEVRA